ncbi:MAG: sigma-70 family RNA polymerase sigma factor [Bacteroidales bacterium]|nr:sigma-70 family RNA polymerase sigma factor [Bacteroidales bacterium]
MDLSSEYNKSFSAMIERHKQIIFSVCYFYATNDVPFDDLRQEVLISLFRGYGNFRRDSAESTWVYRVCINTCLFSLRRFSPKIRTTSIDQMPQMHVNDENDNELREKLEWLHAMISQLNPIDKALMLMWLDELSYDDIADNMGITRNTVASRLHRIKLKLSAKKEG